MREHFIGSEHHLINYNQGTDMYLLQIILTVY